MTEQMQAAVKLRESEETFRLLVQNDFATSIPIDLLRTGIPAHVKDYAIFMIDTAGYVGSNFSAFYPPEDKAAGKPQADLAKAEAFRSDRRRRLARPKRRLNVLGQHYHHRSL
ncbi:hypothetical protein [Cupriavidus plantarum]|uniref:hypothetical protein n=1 Tax=Cupriavidus plantarum TaxID=942865 RepID=UPI00339D58A7